LDQRTSYNTLYPVWRLVDAAAGKDAADSVLTSATAPEQPQASKPSENGRRYGRATGDVSDGDCRCKSLCETGQSRFSPGNTVGECKVRCQVTFSGCTRGEIRSNVRRD
jgi:hypothetical protein